MIRKHAEKRSDPKAKVKCYKSVIKDNPDPAERHCRQQSMLPAVVDRWTKVIYSRAYSCLDALKSGSKDAGGLIWTWQLNKGGGGGRGGVEGSGGRLSGSGKSQYDTKIPTMGSRTVVGAYKSWWNCRKHNRVNGNLVLRPAVMLRMGLFKLTHSKGKTKVWVKYHFRRRRCNEFRMVCREWQMVSVNGSNGFYGEMIRGLAFRGSRTASGIILASNEFHAYWLVKGWKWVLLFEPDNFGKQTWFMIMKQTDGIY